MDDDDDDAAIQYFVIGDFSVRTLHELAMMI